MGATGPRIACGPRQPSGVGLCRVTVRCCVAFPLTWAQRVAGTEGVLTVSTGGLLDLQETLEN